MRDLLVQPLPVAMLGLFSVLLLVLLVFFVPVFSIFMFIFVFMRICNHKRWVSKEQSWAISCPPTLTSWSRSTMTGFKWHGSHNSTFHWRERFHKAAQTRHPITLPLKPRCVTNKQEGEGSQFYHKRKQQFGILLVDQVLWRLSHKWFEGINLEHWLSRSDGYLCNFWKIQTLRDTCFLNQL